MEEKFECNMIALESRLEKRLQEILETIINFSHTQKWERTIDFKMEYGHYNYNHCILP